ncbi:hypothetical protein AVEN_95225-2-1, partial [Araneus ventricosus]
IVEKELHAASIYGRAEIRKSLVIFPYALKRANDVDFIKVELHTNGNKSSGLMNQRVSYFRPPGAFISEECPQKICPIRARERDHEQLVMFCCSANVHGIKKGVYEFRRLVGR